MCASDVMSSLEDIFVCIFVPTFELVSAVIGR
jgi:hypothetical protein